MNVFAQRSLLRRLVLYQFVVIASFVVFTLINLLWESYKPNKGDYDTSLQAFADTMLAHLEPLRNDPAALASTAATLATFTVESNLNIKRLREEANANMHMAFRLLDASGTELYASTNKRRPPWERIKPGAHSLQDEAITWRTLQTRSPGGMLTLQVVETYGAMNDDLYYAVLRFIALPLLLFLPVAALLTAWASRRGLAPLRELARVIARRTPNDLQALGDVAAYAETQPLISEINTLLAKLQATLNRERDFLADAAHELRTPLAVIQAQVHVLNTACSDTERQAAVNDLNLGVARASSLINKLLMTARLSGDDFKPRMELVDLTPFTQERIASLSLLAAQKNIELELTAPSHMPVRMERDTFISALDNVIENAIRYTPAQGKIAIEIDAPTPSEVRLRVADNGIGIAPEHHDKVFERFFRVQSGEQQGSGLGLAIVKRVMTLHGGRASLSQGLGQRGLTVELALPQHL
jgi:signal transduction histidine kinase